MGDRGRGPHAGSGTDAGAGTPRFLLPTNKNAHPTRKGVVVPVTEETRRETFFVNKLLDAIIWRGQGIHLVLDVPVEIQSAETSLPLIVPRLMTGVVVPWGNVIPA